MIEHNDGEHELNIWYDESIHQYRIDTTGGGVVLANDELDALRNEITDLLNKHGGYSYE